MKHAMLIFLCLPLFSCERAGENLLVGQLASDRIELSADYAEPVTARHAIEGETVAAGQLLLEQDTARLDARIAEAQAAVAQQEARLDELTRGPRREQIDAVRAAVTGSRRDVEFLTLEFNRARDVFEKQLAAQEAVDRARAALQGAEAQLSMNEARLAEMLNGTTVEELRQAESQLQMAAAQLSQLEIDRQRLRITAPAAAILDTWLIEPGERPQPGQALAVLLTGSQPYARVYVPEEMRLAVTPGASAEIHIDGRASSVPGRVRWVASEAAFTPFFALTEHDRGHLTYLAKIDIETAGARLPDGVPVQVEIAGARRD